MNPSQTIEMTIRNGFLHTCVHKKTDIIPFIKSRSNLVLPDLSLDDEDEDNSTLTLGYDEPIRLHITWSKPKMLMGETSAMTYSIKEISLI